MSYGYKILKAAVEQQIEFKNYDSYKDYISLNYVVTIKEHLNLDGTFVAILRKRYNNNNYLDVNIEPDLYTIGEYEDMRMFAKSLNVGDEVLCEFDDNIIKTEIVKRIYRSDDPEWYDNTTIENLRETDLGVEYDYSGEFITDGDCVYLFMKAELESTQTIITNMCPGCHKWAYMRLTREELNKAILFQNTSTEERKMTSRLNEIEWKFINTGYCIECQNKMSGKKEVSKRIFYKKMA